MADEHPWTSDENEEFLRKIRDVQERLGMRAPKVEIRFQNLSVEANVHVSGRALPTLVNATINSIQAASFGKILQETNLHFLRNFNWQA